jgi:hypothetical protein
MRQELLTHGNVAAGSGDADIHAADDDGFLTKRPSQNCHINFRFWDERCAIFRRFPHPRWNAGSMAGTPLFCGSAPSHRGCRNIALGGRNSALGAATFHPGCRNFVIYGRSSSVAAAHSFPGIRITFRGHRARNVGVRSFRRLFLRLVSNQSRFHIYTYRTDRTPGGLDRMSRMFWMNRIGIRGGVHVNP